MITMTTEFKEGDKVRITGERGTVYIVKRTEPYADGSLLVFGGSANPNGNQRFRNVQPDRLTPCKDRRNDAIS